jgi:small-conductance mechanosensitive channel
MTNNSATNALEILGEKTGITEWFASFTSRVPFLQSRYFHFLLVVIVAVIIVKIIEAILVSKKIGGIKNKNLKSVLAKSFSRNFIIIGIIIALDSLGISEGLVIPLRAALLTILMIVAYFMIKGVFKSIFSVMESPSYFKKSRVFKNKNLKQILERFVNITLGLIIITLILGIWGIEIGPILTGLGIAGLAVGLAVQDSLSHIFGGISLILDDAYSLDNYIELENGQRGTVYHIGYRSTQIRTFNDEILIIPNGKLAGMEIKNHSRPTEIYRLSLDVGVAYGSDPIFVKDVILNAVLNTEGILDFPEPSVFFSEMKDFSLNFKLYANIRTPMQRLFMTDKIYSNIYNAFKENGIQIPFPTSTVYLKKEIGD